MNNDKLREAATALYESRHVSIIGDGCCSRDRDTWIIMDILKPFFPMADLTDELTQVISALRESRKQPGPVKQIGEHWLAQAERLLQFPAPAPVGDKALAKAIARLGKIQYKSDSVEICAIDTVIAALRAEQQEVAELRERLNIILTDSTYEGGVRYWIHKHDQLLKLLPDALTKARAAGEGKGAT